MVSSPPSSFEGKRTFLGMEEGKGDAGAEWTCVCVVVLVSGVKCSWEEGMLGEEDDLRDDFRGLPLERRMGVEETRGRGDSGDGVSVDAEDGEDGEDECKKGVVPGTSRERLNALLGLSLSGGGLYLPELALILESSSLESGVAALLESESWDS
jgi:hypothetical protein